MWLLRAYLRRARNKPYVRPWALAAPVAVLLVCLPLLRPLRHPAQLSRDEELRLATISAIVEHADHPASGDVRLASRLAIDPEQLTSAADTILVDNHLYSAQSPTMAVLLSGPYWVLQRMGYRLNEWSVLVPYLLTLLGVTLPAAAAAGIVYRMGRTFELTRPWRSTLGASCVFASGLISYAVVLNPHVPAAVLVLAAAGCLVHLAASKTPSRGGGWLIISGLCAALAAAIDPPAIIFLFLFLLVVAVMRLRPTLRVGGILLYLIGTMPPLLLHATLTVPITGDLLPGSMHPEWATSRVMQTTTDTALRTKLMGINQSDTDDLLPAGDGDGSTADSDDDDLEAASIWQQLWRAAGRLGGALLGAHGVFSHFPVVILGFLGMLVVMHRHWPVTTKVLAAVTAAGALTVLAWYALHVHVSPMAAFANRWFIVFLPLLLFWAGAWVRRRHQPAVWAAAGVLLAFSITVSLIGATDPFPRAGYNHYTPVAAVRNLFKPALPIIPSTAIAGR